MRRRAESPAIEADKQYNANGGVRFIHKKPLLIGAFYLHHGERVKIVGQGMAGMPEVKCANGFTSFAFPHDLIPTTP